MRTESGQSGTEPRPLRLLLLGLGFLTPTEPEKSVTALGWYRCLSRRFTGHLVCPVVKPEDMAVTEVEGFRLHAFRSLPGSGAIRNLRYAFHFLRLALRIRFRLREKVDLVWSGNPFLTGLLAVLLAPLLGAKAIVEVNGNFDAAFNYGSFGEPEPSRLDRIKKVVSRALMRFVLGRAAMVKLVYRDQLKPLGLPVHRYRIMSFPNYVPLDLFLEAEPKDGGYLLLMGYPWYLKGVDILIRAFRRIAGEFPDLRCKVVGWCPSGREYFEELAAGEPRMELCPPVYYPDVVKYMTGCTMYVLASRTDSSPRVVREAMAAGKAVVAADIDGVPDLVTDGETGLLFRREDPDDLAEKLASLLRDPELCRRLGMGGREKMKSAVERDAYLVSFEAMARRAMEKS